MTGYPWQHGETLTAQDLNAAIAQSSYIDAPIDGTIYGRGGSPSAAWVPTLPLTGGTVSGATMFGTNSASAALLLNGPPAVVRPLKWQTASVDRFTAQANTNVENGSDAGSNLDWLAHTDAGASKGVFLRITRATGAWTFDPSGVFPSGNITNNWQLTQNNTITMRHNTALVAGSALSFGGSNPASIWQDIAWSGTLNAGASPSSINFVRMRDAVAASPSIALMPLLIDHEINSGFDGNRYSVQLKTNKNATSIGNNASVAQLALFYSAFAGEGGTAGNYLGGHCVLNPDCQIATGAYEEIVTCQENDLRLQSGSHAHIKTIVKLHFAIGDAVHGDANDIALAIHRAPTIAPGTGGGLTVIGLGQANQDWPLDPNASGTSIMQVLTNTYGNLNYAWKPIATYGIDLMGASFTSYAWRSSGFWIDGHGQVPVLGPAAITHSITGTKIAVPNVREVSATVANGASSTTQYSIGDIVCDSIGGLWTVATKSGVNVATVTLLQTGYAAVAPTNPVPTIGGTGLGLTLNITTAATGALTLGDTGQSLGFYGATAVAKPTVTGSKGANAALASLLSALSSLGILTDSST